MRQHKLATGIATAVLVLGLLVAAAATAVSRERSTPGPPGPATAPPRPLITEPAPPGKHRLPFGDVTVTPTAIVAATPDQNIRVKIRLKRSLDSGDRLLVRLRRPGRAARAGERRGVEPITVETKSLSLSNARAGSQRVLELSGLNPPPGRYRLDFLTRDAGGRTRLAGRARVVVYAQHRLPPSRSPYADELSGASLPSKTRALVSGAVNHNVSNQPGNQAETYVAVRPNDPSRVIAGVNPASGNPQAWISDDFMRPDTTVQQTLPSASQLATAEGGGTPSLSLCCDPALAADTLGNLWYAVLTSGATSHIVVNRVAAGTTTFQPTNVAIRRATAGLQDKNMMTIDNTPTSPKFGRLYMVWIENPGQRVVISECDTRPGGVSNAANCDNPNNWTTTLPAMITDATSTFTFPTVAAAPNGDVYVAWWNAGASPAGNEIEIDRCLAASNCRLDGSWGADTTVADLDTFLGSDLPFFCPIIPAPGGRVGAETYIDVGPNGRVYVAFSDLRANGTTKCGPAGTDQTFDSFIARGAAVNAFPPLNAEVRLSDDGALALNDHFFPSLAVDQSTGEVESNLYSTKHDATGQTTHQQYVRSTNEGVSYAAMQQITTATSNFSGANSDGFDYGDYLGADSSQGRFYPSWTDNRAAQGGDAELFMLTSPAIPPPPPPPPPPGPAPDTILPVISSFSIARRFAPSRKSTPKDLTAKVRRGTTIRYTLSEPATVELDIEKKRRGVKLKRSAKSSARGKTRCVSNTNKNKRKLRREIARKLRKLKGKKLRKRTRREIRRARCTLFKSRGKLRRTGEAGKNRVPFSGRIGMRKLRRSSYRIVATGTDAAGNKSKPKRKSFKIVSAAKRKKRRR